MSKSLQSDSRISTSHRARSLGFVPFAAACALVWAGCGGLVEVGDAKDDPEEPTAGSGNEPEPTDPAPTAPAPTAPAPTTPVPTVPEPPDCSMAEATKRATYDTWSTLPNDLGELAGKRFTGYLEGGPDVELVIDAAGVATFSIGDPVAPPVADKGYLCGEELQDGRRCGLHYGTAIEGAVYTVHGASYTDGRLRVPLQVNAAYDAWCSLQTPHRTDVCLFTSIGNAGFTYYSPTGECYYDNQRADCGWIELGHMAVCACTSTECFASFSEDSAFNIDARWSENTGQFSGSFLGDRNGAWTIYLMPADL